MFANVILRSIRDGGDIVRRFWMRYERHISSIALIGGFIIDWLTLTRIDQFFDNLVIITYLVIVALGIMIANFYESPVRHRIAPNGTRRATVFQWMQLFAPTVMQFAIGGLFSAFAIFYSRSAALAVSWPVVFMMFAMLIVNEFLQKRYQRLTMQVTVFFFTLFSYAIFLVPLLLGLIETWVFLISGVVSLLAIGIFLYGIASINPTRFRVSRRGILLGITIVFVVMNGLYYLNYIPPIPLSLERARVAYNVERANDGYRVTVEEKSWLDYLQGADTIHITKGQPIYMFSSVFAPTRLRTNVVHNWQLWSDKQNKWVSVSTISFPVSGGREDGYRGYSRIQNWQAGDWRVDVETHNGLVIGRLPFTIVAESRGDERQTYTW